MKVLIGFAMIVAGIVLGVWAGLIWAFVGGIVDIINEIKADNLNATSLAFGVVKVLFAGLIGWVSALVLIVPGMAIAGATVSRRSYR